MVTHHIIITLDEECIYHLFSHHCDKKGMGIYKEEGMEVFVDFSLHIHP